jgi:hypothetical protein
MNHCKFCGCQDPIGPLPPKLTRYEMKVVMRYLDISPKELIGIICKSTHSLYKMFNNNAFEAVARKLSDYLLNQLKAKKSGE